MSLVDEKSQQNRHQKEPKKPHEITTMERAGFLSRVASNDELNKQTMEKPHRSPKKQAVRGKRNPNLPPADPEKMR